MSRDQFCLIMMMLCSIATMIAAIAESNFGAMTFLVLTFFWLFNLVFPNILNIHKR